MAGQTKYAGSNMVCGARGCGKSTLMKKVVDKTHYKNVLIYLKQINIDEKTFAPIPEVLPKNYKGGKAIINDRAIDFLNFMTGIEKNFRNGMVVIDEAAAYNLMWTNPANNQVEPIPPLLNILLDQRKLNIELYFIYHSVSKIPVRLIAWMNNFILFHQNDEFRMKGGSVPRMDELQVLKKEIEKEYFAGNTYACRRLQLQ